MRRDLLDHRKHHGLRLADREPADGVAVKTGGDSAACAGVPQLRHVAALHDAEQHGAGRRGLERALASLAPAQRQLHRPLDVGLLRRQPHAFVHLHGDVASEQTLHLDRALRRQLDPGAVDMGAEGHRVLADLAQIGQRHHLEAAGIRQHRAVPAGEFLQAAEGGDALRRRPQHQVIGIAERDIGAGGAQVAPVHAFHGAGRADRHEGGRAHHAMRRGQAAGAGAPVGRKQFKVIGKAHIGKVHGAAYRVRNAFIATSIRADAGPKAVDGAFALPIWSRAMMTVKTATKTGKPFGASGVVRE